MVETGRQTILFCVASLVDGRGRRTGVPPIPSSAGAHRLAAGICHRLRLRDCKELSRFLKDLKTQTLRLPLAENRRRHLHGIIDGRKLDTTHVTDRRGRPYTLVCTKTKASYERALKAHEGDLDHLKKMRVLLEWHQGLLADPVRT